MAGIEVHIPYVSFNTKVQGFPRRVNAPATELTIQEHLQYYSNKVMLKTSLEPLNTTDNQVDWEILDGSSYCSIDGSTGELTIDSSTITQMVKVRAKSRANANLYEDKEIVLTHRDVEGIEQMQLQILFEDLASSYTYANDSTVYSFYVKVQPNVDITMGYDILEGTEDIEITNIQPITSGTHKDQVLIQFKLLGTHTNSDVKIRFYDADYPADLYADAEFTAYAPISSISVSGLSEYSDQDQTAHYFWGNEYSFSYYTTPSVRRNLVVECTQNNDKISVWNLPNGNLSSGTIGFTSLTTDSNTVYKVKISDPDDENVYKEVTFLINTPVISDIVVTGNAGRYAYNSDENVYNTIGFYADPSIHRALRLNFIEGDDLISWDVSNRLEDSGDLVFRVLDPSREGITRFLLQDSLYADSSKYVQFGVYTPITSILFNDVQERYVHDASNTAYSFGYYALPNVPRHLDVSVLSGADNISWNLTNVVDSSGQFNFNILGAVAEGNVSLRVSDPYDDSVYADTSFVFYSPISSIDVTGLQDHYICNEDNTTWYEIEVNTTPHVVRNLNISFSGVNWVKENENGSYTKIKFQCIDGSQGQKTLTISDPYWTVNQYTANTMFYEIFKIDSFHYQEHPTDSSYFENHLPAGYTQPNRLTDPYGNILWNIHYQTRLTVNSYSFVHYRWLYYYDGSQPDTLKDRISVSVVNNSSEIALARDTYGQSAYTDGENFTVNVVGKTLDSSAILRISDTLSDAHVDFNIITKAPMHTLTFVNNSSLYEIDREDTSKIFAIKYKPEFPVGREPLVTLTGDTSYITYDTSTEKTSYVYGDIYNNHYFKFNVKDEYKYKDSYLHLKVEDPCDSSVYVNTDFILYSPITSINMSDISEQGTTTQALFFYGTGDSRNTKQIALTREPAEVKRALDVSVGLYDVSTQNGQIVYQNSKVVYYLDRIIPHTIEHYDSEPDTEFITFSLPGDCDYKKVIITAADPFNNSINSSASYTAYVDIDYVGIYDKSDGTSQNLANVYDYYVQPTSVAATLMPTTEIQLEVILSPVEGGTISQHRTSRIQSDVSTNRRFTGKRGTSFNGDYCITSYKLEEYKYEESQLSDVLNIITVNSYASPVYQENIYFQAVIHDFTKEIVFVQHDTDLVVTDPSTMVEISNNRMDGTVIDVDVIYRTLPWYNKNTAQGGLAYPEIINYGNYGNYKPESIEPFGIYNQDYNNLLDIRYNQKFIAPFTRYQNEMTPQDPIDGLTVQGLNVSVGQHYALDTSWYDTYHDDFSWDIPVYRYCYKANIGDEHVFKQSIALSSPTFDTSTLYDVYVYDHDTSIDNKKYRIFQHYDEVELIDQNSMTWTPILSFTDLPQTQNLDLHKLRLHFNFNEWFGHPNVGYASYGNYTDKVLSDNCIDTDGNNIKGKEVLGYYHKNNYPLQIDNYYSQYNSGVLWKTNKDSMKFGGDFGTGYFYPDTSSNTSQQPDINTLKNFEFEIRFYDNGNINSYYNSRAFYVSDKGWAPYSKRYIDNTWSANRDWHYNPAYNPLNSNNYPYRAWRIKFTDGDN